MTDVEGRQITASRYREDMSVRLSLPQPLPSGATGHELTFVYTGKLTGQEDSPVFGIKFAAITPDVAYLMYPARWFPVNDYTVGSLCFGFQGDGAGRISRGGERQRCGGCECARGHAHGALSVHASVFSRAASRWCRGEPKTVSADGVTTTFYLRQARGDGAGLRRGDRQGHGVFHGPVRAAVHARI